MKKKKSHKKTKKVTLTLALRDYEKLTQYSKQQKVSRPLAAKRLLKLQLSCLAVEKIEKTAKNQLSLFDSMQIDIFNGTSKA